MAGAKARVTGDIDTGEYGQVNGPPTAPIRQTPVAPPSRGAEPENGIILWAATGDGEAGRPEMEAQTDCSAAVHKAQLRPGPRTERRISHVKYNAMQITARDWENGGSSPPIADSVRFR